MENFFNTIFDPTTSIWISQILIFGGLLISHYTEKENKKKRVLILFLSIPCFIIGIKVNLIQNNETNKYQSEVKQNMEDLNGAMLKSIGSLNKLNSDTAKLLSEVDKTLGKLSELDGKVASITYEVDESLKRTTESFKQSATNEFSNFSKILNANITKTSRELEVISSQESALVQQFSKAASGTQKYLACLKKHIRALNTNMEIRTNNSNNYGYSGGIIFADPCPEIDNN